MYFNTKEIVSILYSDDYTQSQICLYDFLNASFIWKTDLSQNNDMFPFFCDGDKIIAHTKNNKRTLSIINYFTGTSLWIFHLSDIGRWYNEFDKKWEEGRVEHFVGVVNEVLWVNVASGTIIGINVETGELKHLFTEPNKIIGIATKPHQQSPHFWLNYDEKRNILFGFHYDVFGEIDLNKSEPTLTFYILEDCTKHQTFCPNLERYCYDDNYFYYLDAFNGKIGIINRNTKKLDWVYTFPEGSTMGILMKIEVSKNHLFVLDSGGVLHIFEKEEIGRCSKFGDKHFRRN